MSIALIFFFLVVLFFLHQSRKYFYGKYIILFAAIWFVNMTLMAFDVCQVGGIKTSTMTIILSSVLLYVIGFSIPKGSNIQNTDNSLLLDKRIETFFNSKPLLFFYAIMIVIVLQQLSIALPLLIAEENMGGGLRVDALVGKLYSPMFYTFNTYIFGPLYSITLPLSCYLIVTGKKRTAQILTALYSILYPSLFGGRMAFFVFGFTVFLCYLWLKNSTHKLVRQDIKRIAAVLAVVVVSLFSIMTIAKSGDVTNAESSFKELREDMVNQPLRYFVCPQKAFEYAIEHDYPSKLGGYMYGRATFACIDFYVNPVMNKMEGSHNPNANSKIGYLIQDEWISLSPNVPNWNALYTALLHFYLDFGVIGCLVFSLLFGILTRWAINKLLKKASLPFFILSFFFMTKCIMSFFSYQPVGGDVLPFLLYCMLWNLFEKNHYGTNTRTRLVH